VFGHRRLDEQRAAIGIDAAGDEIDRHVPDALRHLGRLVALGDGVEVDDAEEAAVPVLQLDPRTHRSQVIAQMQLARRLNPREDRFHRRARA
jgi:hypothetical protein